MTGSLDVINDRRDRAQNQVSRVDKLDAPLTAPGIKSQIDTVLNQGWNLIGIYLINGNDFAVYTRPKRQT